MDKITTLHTQLQQANQRLTEALQLPADNTINRDASIQRFEFTFELSWKLMQAVLHEQGIRIYGVKTIFREAAKLKIISDPIPWFELLNARNLATHTYNEQIANQVYSQISQLPPLVQQLLTHIHNFK